MLRAQLGREGGRKKSRCERLVDSGSRELVWRLQATLAAIWTINSTMQSALKRPISDALAHLLTQEWTEREKLQRSKAMEYQVLRGKRGCCAGHGPYLLASLPGETVRAWPSR